MEETSTQREPPLATAKNLDSVSNPQTPLGRSVTLGAIGTKGKCRGERVELATITLLGVDTMSKDVRELTKAMRRNVLARRQYRGQHGLYRSISPHAFNAVVTQRFRRFRLRRIIRCRFGQRVHIGNTQTIACRYTVSISPRRHDEWLDRDKCDVASPPEPKYVSSRQLHRRVQSLSVPSHFAGTRTSTIMPAPRIRGTLTETPSATKLPVATRSTRLLREPAES